MVNFWFGLSAGWMHCDKSTRCLPLSYGCQLVNTQFEWVSIVYQPCDPVTYLITYFETLVMLYATVTCFTLCPIIKSWCAAAVESVHSVCAGPVVFTGMTCTVIDICFRREDWKKKNIQQMMLYLTKPAEYKQEQQQVCIPRTNSQLPIFSFFSFNVLCFFFWLNLVRPFFSGTWYFKRSKRIGC